MTSSLERAIDDLTNAPLEPCTDAETQLLEVLQERGAERYLIKERTGLIPHFHFWEYDIYGEVSVGHTHTFNDDDHEHPNEEKPERPDGSHPWDY